MHHDILLLRELAETELRSEPMPSQRKLAAALGLSLGKLNGLVKAAEYAGHIISGRLSQTGQSLLDEYKVDNAIILSAGFGSRFVPLTYDTPKGLLKVKGQPMIERQIEQLREVGITDISIVVGYLKESFDYLIDKYPGVSLVYNPEYATKNNFVSLYVAGPALARTYVLASDNWMERSIFHAWEPDSWMAARYFEGDTAEWIPITGSYDRITKFQIGGCDAWATMGPSFFTKEFSEKYLDFIEQHYLSPGTDNDYWEHVVKAHLKQLPPIYVNKQPCDNLYEFEDINDLRRYDAGYMTHSGNPSLARIAEVFGASEDEIVGIHPVKEGMTNNSFVFEVRGARYVFRIPGPGTDRLISRSDEKRNYELISPLHISDEIIWFDGASGEKISRYYDGARTTDVYSDQEVKTAMEMLRRIHQAGITPENSFDIEERISFYEGLALAEDAAPQLGSIRFTDYWDVKAQALHLLDFRRKLDIPNTLCHIDYIFANILWLPDGSVKVIDWEYSGAADPLIDIAMFTIYSYLERERADLLLRYYLGREPSRQEEARLYMYIALAGFLWSIWCQYKQSLGEEFGDYPLIQYRYMKDFYHILTEEGYLDE